jgi:hypothetical protein
MDIDVNGTGYSSAFDYGNGTYDIIINCSDTEFNGYGWFAIRINASKALFINQSKILMIQITGETELSLIGPANYSIYTNTDTFNITVYYNDTIKNQPISGANLDTDVNGTTHTPLDQFGYGNGYYNITINCGHTDFSSGGSYNIGLNISKQYYYLQSIELIINITVLANNTNLIIQNPANFTNYDSGDIFNISIYFNDTTANQPISSATIEIDVNGSTYSSAFDYGNGTYDIIINCSDTEFNGYGSFAIRINASKALFINQSRILIIQITGETDLSVISPANYSQYDSGDNFNIRVYFNDTVKNLPLPFATIFVDVNGTIYPIVPFDNANGSYDLPINCMNALFSNYGWFAIRINISLQNYFPQSKILDIRVIGLTQPLSEINLTQYSQILISNGTAYEAYLGENVTVYMNYFDLNLASLITNAMGNVSFNSVIYSDNDIDSDGLYFWKLNTSQLTLGSYFFIVNFTLLNYQSQEITINFSINKHNPQIEIISQPSKVKPGNSFDLILRVFYQYSIKYNVSNGNLTLSVDFGTSTEPYSDITNLSGLASFNIPVPAQATKITITWNFNGTNSVSIGSSGFSITLDKTTDGGGGPPPPPDMTIIIIIIVAALAGGSLVVIVVKRGGGKTKAAKPKAKPTKPAKPKGKTKAGPPKQMSVKKPKGKPKAGPPKPLPAKKTKGKPKKAPKPMSKTMPPSALPADLKKELLERTRPKEEIVVKKGKKEVKKDLREVKLKPLSPKKEPDVKTAIWAELKTALAAKREQVIEGKKPAKPFVESKVAEEKAPVPRQTVVIRDEQALPKIIQEEIERVVVSIVKQEKPKTSEALVNKILEITKLVDISITDTRVKLIIMQMRKANKIKYDPQRGWDT